MQTENDFIPYYPNVQKNKNLPTTLVVSHSLDSLINCDNPETYTQLMIYTIYNEYMADIDLSKFINLRVLYVHNIYANIINIPDSLTGLIFAQCYVGINIPYKESIKYVFSRSSMGEPFIDFSEAYHKYKLHNFNYNSVVSTLTKKIMKHDDYSFDKDMLDSIIMSIPTVVG